MGTNNFAFFGHSGPGDAGLFGALMVGWLVVMARGLYLSRHLFTLSEIRGDGGSKTPTILLLVLVDFVASIEMSTQDVKILAISQTLGKILQKQQNHLQDVALLVLQDDPII